MTEIDGRVRLTIDAGVATVTIAQPDKKNAVAPAMWDALAAHFQRCSDDPQVRVVILTGEGDTFCSGSDLGAIDMASDVSAGLSRLRRGNRMILSIYNCAKPVVAAVRGAAVGVGWSLALACDFVLAAETARFTQGFVKIGLMPDGGSIYFLSRLIGAARAKHLAYSGRFVSASETLEFGLAVKIFAERDMAEGVRGFAADLARGATASMAASKRMFRATMAPGLEQFIDQEELAQVGVKATHDFQEGVKAFPSCTCAAVRRWRHCRTCSSTARPW
jgi:2-(1,2-epoxy-1,2-dihydrophenyl)acetyl-CoA isomerase